MIILIAILLVGFGLTSWYDFYRVSAHLALIDERVKRIEHRIIANEVVDRHQQRFDDIKRQLDNIETDVLEVKLCPSRNIS
jgi:hypothetical protein